MENLTLELTPTQLQALHQRGKAPVRLVDPDTHKEYVLLQAELYQQLQNLLFDDGEEPQRSYPLADEVFNEGWDDLKMAEYDHYEDFRK